MRRFLLTGLLSLLAAVVSVPGQEAPVSGWRPAARMAAARTGHCAVALSDGRVLVAGGQGAEAETLATVEIYGPADAYDAAAPMASARSGHRCTLLEDGRVLVSGGSSESAAEVFDPTTGAWTAAGGDAWRARLHTATLLPLGRVLLAGGTVDGEPSWQLAIFDTALNEIRVLASTLITARTEHIAAPLERGKVLLAGGQGASGALAAAEIFDPEFETIWPAAAMNLARTRLGAATLAAGQVLVAGGSDGSNELGNAEIYVAAEDRWQWVAAPMNAPRSNALVIGLASGLVLIAGGERSGLAIGDTEIYDPAAGEFRAIGALTAPRSGIAGAIVAETGAVLATGGLNESGPSALCGTLLVPTIVLVNEKGSVPANGFTDLDVVYASGKNWGAGATVSFGISRTDGVAVDPARLRTASITSSSTGSFLAPIILLGAKAGDMGATFRVGATQSRLLTDAVTFTPKLASSVSLANPPGTIALGTPASYGVVLNSAVDGGPMSGTVTVRTGTVSQSVTVNNVPRGTSVSVPVCCIQAPGSYPVQVSYTGAGAYRAASIGATLTVTPGPLTLSLSLSDFANLRFTGYPLFTSTRVTFRLSGPAGVAAAPSGTVTVVRLSDQTTQSAVLTKVADGVASGNYSMKATFADRSAGGLCLDFRYPGDANYAATTIRHCGTVTAAPVTVTLNAPSSFVPSSGYTFSGSVTFPAELGIVNRSATLYAISTAGTKTYVIELPLTNVQVGSASGGLSFIGFPTPVPLPFNTVQVRLEYTGGGDLLPGASAVQNVTRELTPTSLEWTAIASPAAPSLPLEVTIRGIILSGGFVSTQGASGTVRFYDGALLIGQVPVVNLSNGYAGARMTYNSPVGARTLRAEYSGDSEFKASVSGNLTVTVQ